MADIEIPETARQFFLHGVTSIAEWEAVLLLRENPDKAHDAASLAKLLYIREEETSAILDGLVSRGVALRQEAMPPVFRYAPNSADLDEVIAACAKLYREYLIPVTRIIHSERKNRLRAFADAFRIRRD